MNERRKKPDQARLLAIFIVLLSIVYFYLNVFAPQWLPKYCRFGVIRQPLTVLIVGTDIRFDGNNKPIMDGDGRTDTIMLVRFDPVHSKINILSIPRDTYTLVPGYGMTKINAAHVYGGIPLARQAVTELTGIKIDHYLEVSPLVITKMVDLLGGVQIEVEKDMYYTDRAQGLFINLKQGWQKLDGKKAHEYIRFRHDATGDIGRIERQQKFLRALTQSLLKPSNLVKAPFAILTALAEIKTDLPITQFIRLVNWTRSLGPISIKTVTVPGEATTLDGAGSVWLINRSGMQEAIKELF
jgi:polyisoprenyl-teichoic acid--peptidoglycan teichoic acid transferase